MASAKVEPNGKLPPPVPSEALAHARSDLVGAALDVVARALVGQLDTVKVNGKDADMQLRAAQLVLTGDLLEHLTDEHLMAEVRRRARLKEEAAKRG